MPSNNSLPASPVDADADLARALQELSRGERTASAMETQLTSLERKIDDLLATVTGRDEPGSEIDKASTETEANATAIGGSQSQKK